jgi:hypothetical protein
MRLLYFSPVTATSYAQRPHYMVRAWLDWGVESVLWVNPYPCRLPRWQDLRRPRGLDDQGTQLDPRVRVLNVPALPIEPLPLGSQLNRRLMWRDAWRAIEKFISAGSFVLGIGRPCALAAMAVEELQPTATFFDATDNFPEFHHGLSRRAMRRHEQAIAAKVDLVIASSTFLAEKFARSRVCVEKILNACDTHGASEVSAGPRIAAQRDLILGYIGCIGRWFDWPLVIRLASAMPNAKMELIGPCVVPPSSQLPENVRLLPPCPHSETSKHLARFSAGLIPFQRNALTAGVDPIKYYEYRAAGLPVLSTMFGEMALRGRDDGVYFLDDPVDVIKAVEAALSHHRDAREMIRFRNENNWTSRFARSDALSALLPALRERRAA